jgi:hypothetical protein
VTVRDGLAQQQKDILQRKAVGMQNLVEPTKTIVTVLYILYIHIYFCNTLLYTMFPIFN